MTTLEQKLEKAQANLDAVNEKIASLRQKAKTYETEIATLKKAQEQEKMIELAEILNSKGKDLDTLMSAVKSGDFSAFRAESENGNA